MNLKFLLITALFPLFSTHLIAAGTVDTLEVENEIVIFSTTESKTATSPACVTEDSVNKWAISLGSQSGRATYSMLLTAMAMGKELNVETADDCAVVAGVERANRVWFSAAE